MKGGQRPGLNEAKGPEIPLRSEVPLGAKVPIGTKVSLGTKVPSDTNGSEVGTAEREKWYLCFLCLKNGRRLSMKNINRHFTDVH